MATRSYARMFKVEGMGPTDRPHAQLWLPLGSPVYATLRQALFVYPDENVMLLGTTTRLATLAWPGGTSHGLCQRGAVQPDPRFYSYAEVRAERATEISGGQLLPASCLGIFCVEMDFGAGSGRMLRGLSFSGKTLWAGFVWDETDLPPPDPPP